MNLFRLLFVIIFLTASSSLKSQSIIDYVKIEDYNYVQGYKGSLNIQDKNGATPLMWASYYCDLEMVKLLVSKGANPNLKGILYEADSRLIYGSSIVIAASKGKLEIVKYFVEYCNVPVDDKELVENTDLEKGWNALQWAAVTNQCDVIRYLVKQKADIEARCSMDGGNTALLFATRNNNFEAVELLFKLGAKAKITNNYENNAIDIALNVQADVKIIECLLENKVKCTPKNKERIVKFYNLENL